MVRIVGRDGLELEAEREERPDHSRVQERLRETLGRDRGVAADAGAKPSVRERLDAVLNKPRERLELEDEREPERDEEEKEISRDVDRSSGHSL